MSVENSDTESPTAYVDELTAKIAEIKENEHQNHRFGYILIAALFLVGIIAGYGATHNPNGNDDSTQSAPGHPSK